MDGGTTWHGAAAVEPQFQYSWARFRIDLALRTGMYTLMTRATDAAGNTQPNSVPFNAKATCSTSRCRTRSGWAEPAESVSPLWRGGAPPTSGRDCMGLSQQHHLCGMVL